MNNDSYNPFSRGRLGSVYEEYFRTKKWPGFKPELLSVTGRDNTEVFVKEYHDLLRNFQQQIFTNLMRIEWIDRHIWYNGKSKESYRSGRSGKFFGSSLKFFHEHYVGFTRRFWSDASFAALRTYANDLYIDFDERDGFTDNFEYPFQYLPLEALYFVAKMPERMKLLEEGEKQKLGLLGFYDYVAQYITNVFLETGKDYKVYWLRHERSLPYINEKLTFVQRMKRKLEKKI